MTDLIKNSRLFEYKFKLARYGHTKLRLNIIFIKLCKLYSSKYII